MKKYKFLLLLLFALAMFSVAYAAWIISTSKDISPTYDPLSYIKYELDNKSSTYNTNNQYPNTTNLSNIFGESDYSFTYKYKSFANSDYSEYSLGLPKNAGNYKITVSYGGKSTTLDYTINKANPSYIVPTNLTASLGQPLSSITLPDGFSFEQPESTLINLSGSVSSYTLKYTPEDTINYNVITGINVLINVSSVNKLLLSCANYQTTRYNGSSQGPVDITVSDGVNQLDLSDVSLSYKYKTASSEYSDGLPTVPGNYTIQINASSEGYTDADALEVAFIINRMQITKPLEDSSTFVYNGSNQTYSVPESTYYTVSNNVQVNAGNYNVSVSLIDVSLYEWEDGTLNNVNFQFNIAKLQIKLKNKTIEINYDASIRTWAQFSPSVKNEFEFLNIDNSVITLDSSDYSVQGMHNGIYQYGSAISGVNGLDTSMTNVVGSTYAAFVSISNTNYELIGNAYNIVKYKTALIGSTYYTIEDAFSSSGTISFAGDSTSATSFVATSFTKLSSKQGNPYGATTYTLNNRTLLVPYNNSTSLYEYNSATTVSNVYAGLYIPDTITINVTGSGKFNIGGYVQSNAPVCGAIYTRGVVINDGTITVASGCQLNSYGYLKGNGLVDLASGSTSMDVLRVYDYPGGSAASSMYKNCFPLNKYSVHNVSCKTKINAGALYKAYAYIYVPTGNLSFEFTDVYIVGSSSTSNCIFKPTGSTGYLIKYAAPALAWTSGTNFTALDTFTGSNQIAGQRDMIEVHGSYQDATLSISKNLIIITVALKTSTSISLPICFMNIEVCNGGSLSFTKSDFAFLPGSSLTIDKGGTLTIGSGVDLVFSTVDYVRTNGGGTAAYAYLTTNNSYGVVADKVDSKLIVNGTLINNGNIGGLIQTTTDGATLNLSSGNVSGTYISLYSTGEPYYYTGNFAATGNIEGTANSSFTKTSYVSYEENGNYYWIPASNVSKFNFNFYDGSTKISSKEIQVVGSSTYIFTGDEYIPTKKYYDFVGWYTDSGLNNPATGLTYTDPSVTINLYAKWTLHEFSFSYACGYGYAVGNIVNYVEANYTDVLQTFTIEDFVNNVLVIPTRASWNGKYFNGWYLGINSDSGVKLTQITKSNLDMFIDEYGTHMPIPLYCEFTDVQYVTVAIIDNEHSSNPVIQTEFTFVAGQSINSSGNSINIDTSIYDLDTDYSKYFDGFKDTATNIIYTLAELKALPITEDKIFVVYWNNKYSVDYNGLDLSYYKPGEQIIIQSGVAKADLPGEKYNTKYKFDKWMDGSVGYAVGSTYTVNKNISFTPSYIDEYEFILTLKITDAHIIIDGRDYSTNSEIRYTSSSETPNISVTFGYWSSKKGFKVTWGEDEVYKGEKIDESAQKTETKYLNAHTTLTAEGSSCITGDTFITLADGSKKMVKDLTGNELLLVWNFETGTFDYAPMIFIDSDPEQIYEVITLTFSDETSVDVIAEHGFFDVDLAKYVYLDNNASDYIGHRFINENNEIVTLVDVTFEEKLVKPYSPITFGTFCYYVNGMLSMPGGIDGMFNYFDIDTESMKYDEEQMAKDIAMYGELTLEDYEGLINEYAFDAFCGKWLSISIGKGLITWEDIEYLVERYGIFFLEK